MTEKEALLWVLGILGSLCAAAITLDKVLDIIHKYIKKAKEPDAEQDKRLDEMDRRIGALEQGQLQHGAALTRDLGRFTEIDEVNRLTLEAVRAQIAALDAREPENMDSDSFEDWADRHEELEDLADDILDRLDEMGGSRG